jgi:tRNA dimethylallyltransferase
VSNGPPLVVVVGPTASGKSELALRLAECTGGEIVNADSVQVYRYFDIGSAKPSPAELARVPHHLIGVADPTAPLDAGQWCALADAAIGDIVARGRTPVVCGGTFLWVKALLYGLAPAPPADAELRERHRRLAETEGRAALHLQLGAVDPSAAARLNPNDFVRVSRALEVFELTGRPLSEFQAEHGFSAPRYSARLVGVAREREVMDQRIHARTQAMFQAGWVDEVRELLRRGFGDTRPMLSVGYRQIAEALAAPTPLDLVELELSVYRATRVFARRQRTWLRDQPVEWLAPDAQEPCLAERSR